MDLQKLDRELREYDQHFLEQRIAFNRKVKETEHKLNHDGYIKEDRDRELQAFYQQQKAKYNLRDSIRPLLNEVIAAYVIVTAEEREGIRAPFRKYHFGSDALFEYIWECIECLESPEDEDVFRLALIASSIDNYATDFRDMGAILAELAIAAVKAGINMESHCNAIAELSVDARPPYPSMKQTIATFHIYAPKAVSVYDSFPND